MDTKKSKTTHGGKRSGSGRKPGSKNKITLALKEFAGQYAEEAVLTLVDVMRDTDAPHQVRVMAADKLLDRGHGKPTQFLDTTIESKGVDTEELTRRYIKLMERSCQRQIETANERRDMIGDARTDQLIEEANKRLERIKQEASQ